jgi:hypothetical protein
MVTLKDIQEFLEPKKLAIAGASRNPKKFGGTVVTEMVKRGYKLFPVHPDADEIQGVTCYKSITDLPEGVDRLYIVTRKNVSAGLVREAAARGIRMIWIQQHSETPEALEVAGGSGIRVIQGKCIFMFLDPVSGPHAFHRWVSKLFGSYPKKG